MTAITVELGLGYSLTYVAWAPDRRLNPRYVGIPDVARYGAIVRHPRRPDDNVCFDSSACAGSITFAGEVQRIIEPQGPTWTVESWEPLTLSPSLLCHCGDHGYIREGQWVVA